MKKMTVLVAGLLLMTSISAFADYSTKEFSGLEERGDTKAVACAAAKARVTEHLDAYEFLNGNSECECHAGFVDLTSPRPSKRDAQWSCTVKAKPLYR